MATKAVSSIIAEYLAGGRLNLCPSYQRRACWTEDKNNNFIDSVMRNWPTPLITLYKLHPSNPDDAAAYAAGQRWECVDGQNRLTAIYAFFTGATLRNDKGKAMEVFWPSPAGLRRFAALGDEERDWFESYNISVTIIQSPMSLDERKAMFTRLQDGSKISTAEYIKNSEHPVSEFVSRHGLRDRVLDTVSGLMTAAKGDWMDVIADCATLYTRQRDGDAAPLEALDRTQAELRKVLKAKEPPPLVGKYAIPIDVEDDAALLGLFERLLAALGGARGDKVKCHKFHVTVLFWHFLSGGADVDVETLRAWFKNYKTIVEDTRAGVRSPVVYQAIFEELTDSLRAGADDSDGASSAAAAPRRRAIPKKKRDALWVRHFGASGTGVCQCCEAPITFLLWEQAHILAVAEGGSNDLDNLVPTCRSCNRSCGKENLRDWCVREYPRAPFLAAEAP